MTIQYNVPVKVLDLSKEHCVETSLRPYTVFTDRSGNLDQTAFSRERFPYVGEVIVVKTLKHEAAKKAHEVLSSLDGLLVLPITECNWEEDDERIRNLRTSRQT